MRIVLATGVFDLLHPGHIDLLMAAKQFGDKLIVGINSDESARKIKGEFRPYISAHLRSFQLSSLSCVDEVRIFHNTTPCDLIGNIKPHVYVKGSDYLGINLKEIHLIRELGIHMVFVPRRFEISTTDLIHKIRKS